MARATMLMIAFIVSMMFWRTNYENDEISCIKFCVLSGAVDTLLRRTRRPNEQIQTRRPKVQMTNPNASEDLFIVGVHIISHLSFNPTNRLTRALVQSYH